MAADLYASIVLIVVFIPLGLLMVMKPKLWLRWQVWQQKVVMGAKYIPSKKTESFVKVMGTVFLVIGMLVLYLALAFPR